VTDATGERRQLLAGLSALNADLRRHGLDPLVNYGAAKVLEMENLRIAVKATGDYLVDTARKLKGL
jgi:hypothetical protein